MRRWSRSISGVGSRAQPVRSCVRPKTGDLAISIVSSVNEYTGHARSSTPRGMPVRVTVIAVGCVNKTSCICHGSSAYQ